VRWLTAAGLLGAACARIQPPPGGPEDRAPPILVSVQPDSLQSLPEWDDDVEFRFDEVISEGSQPNFGIGTGDIERLVLLSPTHEVPVVRWRRDRITVHPRGGWRPNTVYRVELLAGVRDLRQNVLRESVVVTFTTGAELPQDTLRGRVVDWTTARPVPQALVQALLMPDSLVYRTATDSSGRFILAPMPRGEYLVFGVMDQNRNQRLDERESFDSLRISAGEDSVGELWAFRHDSTPPRVQTIAMHDSVTAQLTLGQPLEPSYRPAPDSVRVLRLPDSTAVAVDAALPKAAFDSLVAARAPRDTTQPDTAQRARPPADTTPPEAPPVRRVPGARLPGERPDTAETGPLTSRPVLSDRLWVRVTEPFVPGGRYFFEIRGVRTVSGVTGDVRSVLAVPEPRQAADTTKIRPDTAGAAIQRDRLQALLALLALLPFDE